MDYPDQPPMLKTLRIQNLAVVEDVTLSFREGLNVLTGSTGAGKSLILGAVNFLLGERANAQAIRAGADTALVEGVFELRRPLETAFVPSGVVEGSLTLRREVHRSGRSQAQINGRTCTLKQLQEVSRRLIEPHGQNEQLRLKYPENHVVYLDRFAGSDSALSSYRAVLDVFTVAAGTLREFDNRMAALKEKQELIEHRLGELDRAKITPGEKTTLEESIRVMENAGDVFETLAEAESAIYDSEESAVALVARVRGRLEKIAGLDARFGKFAEELENAEIALKETVGEMRAYLEGLEFEPCDLERMQERLALLTGFERRYRMPLDELVGEASRWRSELESIEFEDEERKKLAAEKSKRLGALRKAAVSLSGVRARAAADLDKRMTSEMGTLMMRGARFRTDLTREEDPASDLVVDGTHVRFSADGIDRVEFYVRTNPGESEGKLCEVASSGELSRIALALKEVTTVDMGGNLLVFDELDAGVGADMGEMLSGKLLGLAQSYQIVCITHMPQIAARAEHHFVVRKRTAAGRTFADVTPADGDERLTEIARMLGGHEGSEKRLALAREMLQKKRSKITPEVRP